MATYHDLLDAIARVGQSTGDPDAWKDGLTGDDVAVACTPISPPSAVAAVLAKLTAAHPAVFAAGASPARPSDAPPPRTPEGAAADAIRSAEAALARQRTDSAHVDLQVLTAIANAHASASDGLSQLTELQRDIESAVVSRTDLDTPAGAREFQRFLLGKLRDIRSVVDNAGLDATSKATLADALAALYASSTPIPEVADRGEFPQTDPGIERRSGTAGIGEPWPDRDVGAPPLSDGAVVDSPEPLWTDAAVIDPPPGPMPSPAAAMAPGAAPPIPALPSAPVMPAPFGGGLPAAAPSGGLPGPAGAQWPDSVPERLSLRDLQADGGRIADLPGRDDDLQERSGELSADEALDPATGDDPAGAATEDDPAEAATGESTAVLLPDGGTVVAPSLELASVITAAVAGTPIPEAFGWQGITIPAPGSPVTAPVEPGRLVPGDIGVFADRHALALGSGKALLDKQIQPISSVTGPGFIGWQHPPEPQPHDPPPATPAPDRTAATAPS